MTINAAFANRTTDGESSGFQMESDSCVVIVHGDSVLNGAQVDVQAATANNAEEYVGLSHIGSLSHPGAITVTLKTAMFVRVRLRNARAGTTVNADIVT